MRPRLPRYRYPLMPTLRIARDVLLGRRRRFGGDAKAFIRAMTPPLRVMGDIPRIGAEGAVILINHYYAPGFRAWWIALALSAVVETDLHWVMTEAWTYPDRAREQMLTPLSRRLFRRLAQVYGFTSMPPMPPRPWEVAARAAAVRSVLHLARRSPRPAIALAPEGGDAPTGSLMTPPPGAGRFIGLLAAAGLPLSAAGIYEQAGELCLHFGPPVDLTSTDAHDDQRIAGRAMRAIAGCLPEGLRGAYT
ncbi:MAG: hypothetical protein A2Y93_09445 [Chloroflexi bacterium RBG_13_68_17]|nr:MAG: hypothetical protein A2Y93_09445 [Chloroflexi bacterium RBG_13_68_17]